MISVEEAKRIIMAHVAKPSGITRPLRDAAGFVLKEVIATHDHPLFDMSAVDGYAFAHGPESEWNVVGEVAAGDVHRRTLGPGECVRIFTGAMVPDGTDTVVMQEFVERTADRIVHRDTRLKVGGNVRRRGEQLRKGEVVLRTGERLNAAAKGLLASVGVAEVEVAPVLKVSSLITGNEFIQGDVPGAGNIFGSNDVMLEALITGIGATASVLQVPDEMVALEKAIHTAINGSDVLISTGGASVGDHDLVSAAVQRCRGRIVFHGVAQKPGKPMLFALFGTKPFFGLPGNPRAVMVLFWEYVLPFLRAMQGAKDPWLKSDVLPIAHALTAKGDRAEFRAAQVKGGRVTLLADEGSHMLRSLVDADALAYLPADRRAWAEGDPIEVHLLP